MARDFNGPRVLIAGVTALFAAGAVLAQDLPTTQLEDHSQVVRQDMLTRSLLRQRNLTNRSEGSTLSSEARATCLNKRRAAANLGSDHPKVRRLYALCAQAGY